MRIFDEYPTFTVEDWEASWRLRNERRRAQAHARRAALALWAVAIAAALAIVAVTIVAEVYLGRLAP